MNGITIIDDFAHHPTAIGETINALRTGTGARCGRCSNRVRTRCAEKCFRTNLSESLAIADQIVVAGIFKPEAIPETSGSPQAVIDGMKKSGKPARELRDADAIVEANRVGTTQSETWLPFFPMADLAESMRSCRASWSSCGAHARHDVGLIRTIAAVLFMALSIPLAAIVVFPWTFISGKIDFLYWIAMKITRGTVWLTGTKIRTQGLENLDFRRALTYSCPTMYPTLILQF